MGNVETLFLITELHTVSFIVTRILLHVGPVCTTVIHIKSHSVGSWDVTKFS